MFGYPKDLKRDIRNLIVLQTAVEERIRCIVATIENLSEAIDAQGQTIQQEAQQVKAQLDQMQATIDALRGQVSPDVQPLVDRLAANSDAIRAIFAGEEPPPGRRPGQRGA
jgi:hypothetical protein